MAAQQTGTPAMLSHLSFGVQDLARAAAFYDRVLAPLGYGRVWASATGVGFGPPGAGDKLALFPRPGAAPPRLPSRARCPEPRRGRRLPRRGDGRRRPRRGPAGAAAALRRGLLRRLRRRPRRAQARSRAPGRRGERMTEPLLDIRGLKTHFATDDGIVHAVDGVDLAIGRGETVGVVGESGCGKTITAMSVLKLIPMPPGRIVAGQILWKGRDLVPLDADAMRKIRSKEIAIVFQEPMTSLNPVY